MTILAKLISDIGFQRSNVDHSVFVRKWDTGLVILAMYVDAILLTGGDTKDIEETKEYLQKHFVTKDTGKPHYFKALRLLKVIKGLH